MLSFLFLVEQILPEHLKTEAMCSNIWSEENDCDCQWESNLSRKTSRRNRMEARFKNHQRLKQYEANKQQQPLPLKPSFDHWRNPNNDSSDDMDEEVFWVSLTYFNYFFRPVISFTFHFSLMLVLM